MPISSLIIWLVAVLSPTPVMAQINNEQLSIAQYAYYTAIEQGIPPDKFLRLIACESELKEKARGDYRSETKEYMANGLLQFWRQTFLEEAKLYDMEDADYTNPYDQIKLAAAMLADGKALRWYQCAKKSELLK